MRSFPFSDPANLLYYESGDIITLYNYKRNCTAMIRVHDGGKAAVRMEVYKDRWSALANDREIVKCIHSPLKQNAFWVVL